MQLRHDLVQQIRHAIELAQQAGEFPIFDIPEIIVERPRDEGLADYASPIALRLTKLTRMAPIKIAETIVRHFQKPSYVDELTVAAPGFLNVRISLAFLQGVINEVLATPNYGESALGAGKRVQIEYVSANPTGPITIGRTRGGVIGDTLARLMSAAGFDVTREYYYNDAGRQIQMLGESVFIRYQQLLGLSAELTDEHYQGHYVGEIAQQLRDQYGDQLVDRPIAFFGDYAKNIISVQQRASLARVGITHDVYFNEAALYQDGRLEETLAQLKENGYLYEQDGAWWLKTTAFGDDQDRVAIRSTDGLPTYRVPDIVYHKDKAVRGFDLVIDIFGPDHHGVAPQVLMGVQMLGYDTTFVHTLLHQIVNLIRDGETLKMSTRRGTYVTLDELVDEVGSDPVRYFMLARSATSHVDFDMDLAIERSDKNPVFYIQNAHVRCAGILRKWAESGQTEGVANLALLTHPKELTFLKKILGLSDVIEFAALNYEPHSIAFYALDLASSFHPLYDECRVLGENVSAELAVARLQLYRAAKAVFARVLDLMGMSAPDFM